MKTIKIKIICVAIYLILWLLLVISFLAPWYEEKFKKDIFDNKDFEFNQFLINNKEVLFNKVDALEGEEIYLRDAFGFETPHLLMVLRTIRSFLSIGFVLYCFLAILTILFMIDLHFIPKDNNARTRRELLLWRLFFTYGPCAPTLFLFISLMCIYQIPKASRSDCYQAYGIDKCELQLRYHSSFKGENDIWSWGPGEGWKTLLVSTIVSFVLSIFSVIIGHKVSLLE